MNTTARWAAAALVCSCAAAATERAYPPAKVDFDAFQQLVAEVEPHRRERLVDLDTFLRMSREPGVVVLDTRSTYRYDRIHLQGARHLGFSDFTQDRLGEVIPSLDSTVLIYCNNNFDGNPVDFPTKVALPVRTVTPGVQMRVQEKPLMLALNVPTYITLYGYGYRNVYELDELVQVTDPRIRFEGSIVEPRVTPPRSAARFGPAAPAGTVALTPAPRLA
ncbi:MAG: rhodanese-like domain-containing protein [Xanthomonadales bacterium]|nr:rhodanese-like domain-containing protein [Xanthomonadales bacterium]